MTTPREETQTISPDQLVVGKRYRIVAEGSTFDPVVYEGYEANEPDDLLPYAGGGAYIFYPEERIQTGTAGWFGAGERACFGIGPSWGTWTIYPID